MRNDGVNEGVDSVVRRLNVAQAGFQRQGGLERRRKNQAAENESGLLGAHCRPQTTIRDGDDECATIATTTMTRTHIMSMSTDYDDRPGRTPDSTQPRLPLLPIPAPPRVLKHAMRVAMKMQNTMKKQEAVR